MDTILEAGIELIVFVQAHSTPATDRFFSVFTQLGAMGYLLLVPLVLWCFDFRLGVRVALAMAATLFVNTVLKEWIALDRPFVVDDRIVSEGERGYSMPSGHAQLVVVYWALVAQQVGRRGFWGFAVAWMFLMGFSRTYLGVHYPTDVIVGWAIGALTAWAFIARRVEIDAAWSTGDPGRVALYVGGAGALAFVFDLALVGDHTYLIAGIAGFVVGVGGGALATAHRRAFTGGGVAWQRGLRFALGLAIGMVLLGALRRAGVPESDLGTRCVVALDLALFGLFMTGLAPWLFEKARLSPRAAS